MHLHLKENESFEGLKNVAKSLSKESLEIILKVVLLSPVTERIQMIVIDRTNCCKLFSKEILIKTIERFRENSAGNTLDKTIFN